jgi:hypothetical protein
MNQLRSLFLGDFQFRLFPFTLCGKGEFVVGATDSTVAFLGRHLTCLLIPFLHVFGGFLGCPLPFFAVILCHLVGAGLKQTSLNVLRETWRKYIRFHPHTAITQAF